MDKANSDYKGTEKEVSRFQKVLFLGVDALNGQDNCMEQPLNEAYSQSAPVCKNCPLVPYD